MSDYPHRRTYIDPPGAYKCAECGYVTTDRSGHPASVGFGADCPAAMRDEIAALRGQVEAEIVEWLRAQPCAAEGHDDRWCQACTQREDLADAIARRHMTRAATDIENGAHRRV